MNLTCESLRIGRRETCGAPAEYKRIGGYGCHQEKSVTVRTHPRRGYLESLPHALCDLCLKRIYRGFEIRITDFWKPTTQTITQPTPPQQLTLI